MLGKRGRPTNIYCLESAVHAFCKTVHILFSEIAFHEENSIIKMVQVLPEDIVISTDVNKVRSGK